MVALLIINVALGFIPGICHGIDDTTIYKHPRIKLKPIMFLFPSYIIAYWLSYFLFSDIKKG